MAILTGILFVLLVGSLVYCALIVLAAGSYLSVRPSEPRALPAISVLKPLAGLDEGLEENLGSFLTQDYPEFEVLFAVHHDDDPAVPVVARLLREHPRRRSARLIVTGEPPGPNAKAFSLQRLVAEARFDLLVMSDSDVRVSPQMLRRFAAEFEDPAVGLVSCPYRAVPGRSVWSQLEAVGMNTEFLAGVLVARMVEGMKFALGPTIAVRKAVLEQIGGFERLKEYLAEDFVMGKLAAQLGHQVLLSSYVIEHRIGMHSFAASLNHRLRWARSTRRSRPWGYWGQVFTNPVPLALLLWAVEPSAGPLVVVTAIFRAAAAWVTAGWVLSDTLTRRRWWLVPAQDIVAFLTWIVGFFGNTILWRGRKCYVLPDGRFEPVSAIGGTNEANSSAAIRSTPNR